MCSCDRAETPSCIKRATRRARKEHRCCECHRAIPAGATYEYISGIWDGCPDSFKTCSRCVVLREAHSIAEDEPGCVAPYEMLMETIKECARADSDYTRAFQQARRSLLAGEKSKRKAPPPRYTDVLMGDR